MTMINRRNFDLCIFIKKLNYFLWNVSIYIIINYLRIEFLSLLKLMGRL